MYLKDLCFGEVRVRYARFPHSYSAFGMASLRGGYHQIQSVSAKARPQLPAYEDIDRGLFLDSQIALSTLISIDKFEITSSGILVTNSGEPKRVRVRRLRRKSSRLSRRRVRDMHWSVVPFGKYEGKTLPEIIVRDPDWFFWTLPNLYGTLAEEAQELARRARAIKTPRRGRRHLEVEYEFDMDRGLMALSLSTPTALLLDGVLDCHTSIWVAASPQI